MYSEKEYDEYEERMHRNYPKIFAEPYGGFCIGPGWWPLVEALCNGIQHYLDWANREGEVVPQVVVHQIKEKFGGLRFYYEGGDDRIRGMVQMAEIVAEQTCEECGAPGKERGGSWVKTLCDKHHEEREAMKAQA